MQPPRQPPGQPTAELQRQHVRPEEVWPQPVAWWCAMGGVSALRRKWGLGSKAVGPARPAHAMSSNATDIPAANFTVEAVQYSCTRSALRGCKNLRAR